MILGFVWVFSVTSYAQYDANNGTLVSFFKAVDQTVEAAHQIADSIDRGAIAINNTNNLVPSILAKLDAIQNQVKATTETLEKITSIGYIVGTTVLVVGSSVAIGALFVFGRHMANKHHWCGA